MTHPYFCQPTPLYFMTSPLLLNFTTLNLHLKATLHRPKCRASALWRDLVRMFKRSLEKSKNSTTCKNKEKPAELHRNKENPTSPSGTRQANYTPTELPNRTSMELVENSIEIPFENPTKTPPTNQNSREWNTTPPLLQNPTNPPPFPHITESPAVNFRYYEARIYHI